MRRTRPGLAPNTWTRLAPTRCCPVALHRLFKELCNPPTWQARMWWNPSIHPFISRRAGQRPRSTYAPIMRCVPPSAETDAASARHPPQSNPVHTQPHDGCPAAGLLRALVPLPGRGSSAGTESGVLSCKIGIGIMGAPGPRHMPCLPELVERMRICTRPRSCRCFV